ncbi:MAG: ECF-type sigma factor [Acidobacteriota bacterium]
MPDPQTPESEPDDERNSRGSITLQLQRWSEGEEGALDHLLPLVYSELRHIARGQRRRLGGLDGVTSGTTDLVHEAYLRFTRRDRGCYGHREHFFAVAAKAMRRLLLDEAKKRGRQKRGDRRQRRSLDPEQLRLEEQTELMLALNESLERLERVSPRAGRVVEYRFFGGLTEDETARLLGVDGRTVRRDWAKARLWLATVLAPGADPTPSPGVEAQGPQPSAGRTAPSEKPCNRNQIDA